MSDATLDAVFGAPSSDPTLDAVFAPPQRQEPLPVVQPNGGPAGKPSTLTDALQGFGQGASLGLGPYFNAALDTGAAKLGVPNTVFGSGNPDFDANLRTYKNAEAAAAASSPLAYKGAEVAGAINTGVAGGSLAGMGLEAAGARNAGLLGNWASNTAQAGVRGAATAAPGHEWDDALHDATLAFGVTAAAPAVQGLLKGLPPPAEWTAVQDALKATQNGSAAARDSLTDLIKAKAPQLLESDTPTLNDVMTAGKNMMDNIAHANVWNRIQMASQRVVPATIGAAAGGYAALKEGGTPTQIGEAALAGSFAGPKILGKPAALSNPAVVQAGLPTAGVLAENPTGGNATPQYVQAASNALGPVTSGHIQDMWNWLKSH
jgi:hypothetical protein